MASAAVPVVKQAGFTLFASYKPKAKGVKANLLEEDGSAGFEVELDTGDAHYVSGFGIGDRKDFIILTIQQTGVKFLIKKDAAVNFTVCIDLPFGRVGLSEDVVSKWKQQKTATGCWFAAMAVIAGREQDAIQAELTWKDDALYGITTQEIPEFGKMIKCPVKTVDHTKIDDIYAAVSKSLPVVLGVPNHVLVAYGVSADRQQICLWDPSDATLKTYSWTVVKKYFDSAFCKSV